MTLEDGTKFVYLTVGGRTSAVVPSVQKKTGPVAKDVDEDGEEAGRKKGGKKRKAAPKDEQEDEKPAEEKKPAAKKGKTKKTAAKEEDESYGKPAVQRDEDEGEGKSELSIRKKESQAAPETNGDVAKTPKSKKAKAPAVKDESAGRRRSGRVSGKEVSYVED